MNLTMINKAKAVLILLTNNLSFFVNDFFTDENETIN